MKHVQPSAVSLRMCWLPWRRASISSAHNHVARDDREKFSEKWLKLDVFTRETVMLGAQLSNEVAARSKYLYIHVVFVYRGFWG